MGSELHSRSRLYLNLHTGYIGDVAYRIEASFYDIPRMPDSSVFGVVLSLKGLWLTRPGCCRDPDIANTWNLI